MAITSRQDLMDFCLRKCGYPVITINIAPEQIDDCIDEALEYWREYAIDAQERVFLPHQITATDITNKYFTLNDNILSVVNVYGVKPNSNSGQLFSLEYHITADSIINLTQSKGGIEQYFTTKQGLADINWLLNPEPPFRFRIHNHKLYIDSNWDTRIIENNYIMVECYAYIPDTNTSIWNNWQLKRLAAAYVKRQWGSNLSKFSNVALPGGVILNGTQIYEEAVQEIAMIEQEFVVNFSEPLGFITA